MARIVTRISHDEKANPNLWVLSVEDTNAANRQPISLLPCTSEAQAGLFEQQLNKLIIYLGGK